MKLKLRNSHGNSAPLGLLLLQSQTLELEEPIQTSVNLKNLHRIRRILLARCFMQVDAHEILPADVLKDSGTSSRPLTAMGF